jgi:hypothetical protein
LYYLCYIERETITIITQKITIMESNNTLKMTQNEFNNSSIFIDSTFEGLVWIEGICYARYSRNSDISNLVALVY